MRLLAIFMLIVFTGCSWAKLAPVGGAVAGGAAGSVGGPIVAGASAGAGYTAGKLYQLSQENKELAAAITSGDVDAIVKERIKHGLAEQQDSFTSFVGSVKKILYVAGTLLLCYLALPFLWTKKCMDAHRVETDQKLTRAPFPKRPTTGKDK
tara:strand:- start:18389 stop:18844 length:456 start_codon:yes stop_codon:yes gene_type:complete